MRLLLPCVALATFVTAAAPSTHPQIPITGLARDPGSSTLALGPPIRMTVNSTGVQFGGAAIQRARSSEVSGSPYRVTELVGDQGQLVGKVFHTASAARFVRDDGTDLLAEPLAQSLAAGPDAELASLTWRDESGGAVTVQAVEGTPLEVAGGPETIVATPAAPTAPASGPEAAADFALLPNFPNPFRGVTAIRFVLPQPGRVRVAVFDVAGRQVATLLDEERRAGPGAVEFRPGSRAPGRYEVRLRYAPSNGSAARQATRSVLLIP